MERKKVVAVLGCDRPGLEDGVEMEDWPDGDELVAMEEWRKDPDGAGAQRW